jgi:hypothetical protein
VSLHTIGGDGCLLAVSPSARLDGGLHYEHHSHPDTNFGFLLGFMDVLCGAMYVGEKVDCWGTGVRPAHMRRYHPRPPARLAAPPRQSRGAEDEAELIGRLCATHYYFLKMSYVLYTFIHKLSWGHPNTGHT